MNEKDESIKNPRQILRSLPNETKDIIIDYLQAYGATKSNTPELYKSIGKKSYRGLEDAFKYLEEVEGILIQEKDGKAKTWRLKDKNLLLEKLSQKDMTNLSYALELNKNEFDISTLETIKKIFNSNQDFMVGYITVYEEFTDEKISAFYDNLSKAIKEHLYLELEFNHDYIGRYENVKPLKIVFIDNNWYIAFEYTNNKSKKFVLRRLAFVREIKYLRDKLYSTKNTFQTKEIEPYLDFLANVQNAMTLYDVEPKVATIKATPFIAKYFEENMKKFLPSQKFQEKCADGSVLFTLEYTQPLEILPFIQKWLPDLIIVEPKELRDAYIEKLKQSIMNHETLTHL